MTTVDEFIENHYDDLCYVIGDVAVFAKKLDGDEIKIFRDMIIYTLSCISDEEEELYS